MRKAGEVAKQDPDVLETISKHLHTDGVPKSAADQKSTEIFNKDEEYDKSVEHFFRVIDNYKSKGFDTEAAQVMALEVFEGNREEPKESVRFARIAPD